MLDQEPIRLCEWSTIEVDLRSEQRQLIATAVENWRQRNALSDLPLEFGGPSGTRLSARQYVGVVEVEGTAIEVYPKLDKSLLGSERIDAAEADLVMRNLLWILDVSGFTQVLQTDMAHLEESPLSYEDLFAFLMAGDLIRQLELGLAHEYIRQEDNIQWVRGRIRLRDQVTKNWMRPDRIACTWDEFTPDTSINRLMKCACRYLSRRVRHPFVASVLQDCTWMLDEVADLDPFEALCDTEDVCWSRPNERFRRSFDMARRLLSSMGYDLASGDNCTFVFLLDMNFVFETYALKVLEAVVDASVQSQKSVGTLVCKPAAKIRQIPDFWWVTPNERWIADAKYKFLFQKNVSPLPEDEVALADEQSIAVKWSLSPNDLRQLTVYAEILYRKHHDALPVEILVVYPYAGQGEFEFQEVAQELWNGSRLYLMPVKLTRCTANNLRLSAPVELPRSLGCVQIAESQLSIGCCG